MTHSFVRGKIGRHWVLALIACALFSLSLFSVADASSWYGDGNYYYGNYGYTYPYSYDTYGSYYPYNSYYNYGNYYDGYSYTYPVNYYPYGSHDYRYGYNTPPTCTITISPASSYPTSVYRYGYPMQLTWSSSGATSASISPDVGSVSPSGSRVVYTHGETYSMSVYGPGGTAVCQTTSYSVPFYGYNYSYPYNNSYYTYPSSYYSPTYTYPATYTSGAANVVNNYVVGSSSSVSLSQIPYTGVDLGVWGDALLYLVIALSALVGAAMIMSWKPQVFTLPRKYRG